MDSPKARSILGFMPKYDIFDIIDEATSMQKGYLG